jgi:hypothetical protein
MATESGMEDTNPGNNDIDSDSSADDTGPAPAPANQYTELVFKPVMRIAMYIRMSNPTLTFNESVKQAWRTPEAHLLKQIYADAKEKLV